MEYKYHHGDRPLPGYTIKRAVGRGDFGEVYFAVSDGGREVALKRLGDNAEIELRGVKQCINVKSPHLISVFDIAAGTDERPYIIMEYVAGSSPSLRHVLAEHPQGIGRERARFFFHGIASALECLHAQNIVHRDLKPENIFLDGNCVKVGDYGLAKHISMSDAGKQTMNLGTVHYMAPEIATGVYDHRVDIYALGVILYEMLTGRAPFVGKDIYEIALKHVASKPETGDLPAPYDRVVAVAMAKNPNERYGSVQAMAADLGIALGDGGAAAAPSHAQAGSSAEASRAPAPGAARRRLSFRSGDGLAGRLAMTAAAAMAIALAVALAPEWMGRQRFDFARAGAPALPPDQTAIRVGPIGPEFLPLFFILTLGSAFTSSVGLWFYNRMRYQQAAALSCRLLVAGTLSVLCYLSFWLGPYLLLDDRLVWHAGFGVIHGWNISTGELLLFVFFVSLFLVNWLAAASPERPERINLRQACLAACLAWGVCIVTDFGGFMAVSGTLGGLTLCVNFLSPMRADLGLAPAAPRQREEAARPGASPGPAPGAAAPAPVRRRGAWFIARLLFWAALVFVLFVLLMAGCALGTR